MILANICAANAESGRHLCVFRVHDQPDPGKNGAFARTGRGIEYPLC